MFPSVSPAEEFNYPVSFYASASGWNWQTTERLLPHDICSAIENVQPPLPGMTDFPSWNAASDGQFSLNSAYSLLSSQNDIATNPLFKKVWKWKGPARVRAKIWKIAHSKLLTNEERKNRSMPVEDLCPRCKSYPETLMHTLRDCEEVHDFWSKHIKPKFWSKFSV